MGHWTREAHLLAAIALATAGACALGGCSSDYKVLPSPPVAFVPAAHPALPQVAQYSGPIVAAPSIVPVTFDGDSRAPALETFAAEIGQTDYWMEVAGEYGVGAATSPFPVRLGKAAATVDDEDIRTLVRTGGVKPTTSRVYLFFFPAATSVTFHGNGGDPVLTSCVDFESYHTSVQVPGVGHVQYAVIASCASQGDQLQAATILASHELIGAATDPLGYDVTPDPAFYGTEHDSSGFAIATGFNGEVGDMCAGLNDAFIKPDDFPFFVLRAWSNKAAAAGNNPCVPAPADPYFNAMPAANEAIFIEPAAYGPLTTRGVSLANGQSKTIDVHLWSSAPTAPWTLIVKEKNPTSPPALALSLDKTSGKNGDVLHLTITAKNVGKQGAAFVIESMLGGVTTTSGGMVATP
jgi:hypothetical protein